MTPPQPGRYQHYKSGFYRVITAAKHTETGEELVVYQSEKDDKVWVRPKKIFLETVEIDGKIVPRFKSLES